MKFRSLLPLFFLVLVSLLLPFYTGCNGQNAGDGHNSQLYETKVSNKSIQIEAAINETEHRKGFMFRQHLPEDQGMLFIFQRPMQLSFWMQNTVIPLDIGYFDNEGILREIYPLHPHDLTAVKSRRFDLQFALEMNRGWFEKNNIRVGDRLPIKDIIGMLRKRNLAPSLFGLSEK